MFYNEFGTQSSTTETQPIENTQHATKTKLVKKNPKKKLKVVALNKRTNDRFRTLKTKSFKGSWETRSEPLMILEDEDGMLTQKPIVMVPDPSVIHIGLTLSIGCI